MGGGQRPRADLLTPVQTSVECIPCFVRQAAEAVALATEDPDAREKALRRTLHALAEADWRQSPPAIAQLLHRIVREETGGADPYKGIKDSMNAAATEAIRACVESITSAPDPREAAVRVALAGNLLDSAAKVQVQLGDLPQLLARLGELPLAGDPNELFREAEKARRILYLADNAGEIVFDRLLLNFLPIEKVTLAVRGRPILNDALRGDADAAGFTGLVPVIDNGSDAPGTVLEDCSEEFRRRFDEADLVISKGQGNFETLSAVRAPIFFLFTVKCPIVAAQIGEPTGTMVAKKSAMWAPIRLVQPIMRSPARSRDVRDFETQVLARSREVPVLCDFWAPWCSACAMFGPLLEKVTSEAGGRWELAKLNIDENAAVARRSGISGIPAIKLFQGGKVIAEHIGAVGERDLRAWMEASLP